MMTPSEQARADAIADAETLRLYLRDPAHGAEGRIDIIARHALIVEAGSRPPLATPTQNARAAFRAVPGLRGE